MANIFTNAVNFLGTTLKQAVTPDTLRDYRHANQLFVGSNFRLVPKQGFLFHVFFDLDPRIVRMKGDFKTLSTEIAMMAKTVDLPKYTIATKTYNSYNRPNIVQSKISFDPIQITFHDDSADVVRRFWYDYYKYYYRDSDYTESNYRFTHKYRPQETGSFGYSPRDDIGADELRPYLKTVRIYSLHQKRFSEYILINPVIKNFRHGTHNRDDNGMISHEVTIEYEHILYNYGNVSSNTVKGFAELYYDKTISPLQRPGRIHSIFGAGGLLDTADSVYEDIQRGDFASAIFKAASGINMARSMNLKRAALSEITGMVNATATNVLIGAIPGVAEKVNTALGGSSNSRINVVTASGLEGAVSNKYTGILSTTSVPILAGAAVLLNSTPFTNRYTKNPTIPSEPAPTNYNPRLPANINAATAAQTPSELLIGNNQNFADSPTNQNTFNKQYSLIQVNTNIQNLNKKLTVTENEVAAALNQITATTNAISSLNGKRSSIAALSPVTPEAIAEKSALLATLDLQIQQMNNLNSIATNTYNAKSLEIATLQQQLTLLNTEKTKLETRP